MSVIIASRRHFKEKPDVARRFLMAIVEGAHLARTRKELALPTLGRRLKETDPRILEARYKTFALDAFPTNPYPDEVTVRFALEELEREFPGAKDKGAGQFIDASFMKTIDRSGFLDKPYR